MSFQRNLIDDTFNIIEPTFRVKEEGRAERDVETWLGQEITLNNETHQFNDLSSEMVTQNKEVIIRRNTIDNMHFRLLTSFGIGNYSDSETADGNNIGFKYVGFPQFNRPIDIINLRDSNKAIEFKMINTVSYTLTNNKGGTHETVSEVSLPGEGSNGGKNKLQDIHPHTTLSYTHLYLVPHEIKISEQNKKLYDVYIKNDESNVYGSDKTGYDLKLTSGSLDTGKIKNLTSLFNDTNKEIETKDTKPRLRFLGSIDLYQHTYFDYDKNKVIKGFSGLSKPGELIPYDFHGEYHRSLTLGVNAIYGKIIINQLKEIKAPMLNPNDGVVVLKIESKEFIDNILHAKIPFKKIKVSKLKYLKNKIFSQRALDRLRENHD